MPVPPYADLIAPSSTADGLLGEGVNERILSLLAMLACGKSPDGTPLPAFGTSFQLTIPGLIVGTAADTSNHNYNTITQYLLDLSAIGANTGVGGTAFLPPGRIAVALPVINRTNVELEGTGVPPQAFDAGVRIDLFGGSQLVPGTNWQGANQAGHTTIASASNGLTLPQSAINLTSVAAGTYSPAFTNPGGGTAYVLVETIPVTSVGGVLGGGWNLVPYTGITGNQLTGCTLPYVLNAGGSLMYTGMPVVQATPITGCTTFQSGGTWYATVLAANSYYVGQPVIVMANGFTGSYQPTSVFEVISLVSSPSPGFVIQLQGNPGGSFSAVGSATAPYDAVLCGPYESSRANKLGVNGLGISYRAIGICSPDTHYDRVIASDGIVAAWDTECQSPSNTTRTDLIHCYAEVTSTAPQGFAAIWWGNNPRITNLYKTNGTIFDLGGDGNWSGHISGNTPGFSNTYLAQASTWQAQFDSANATAPGLLTIVGRASNPNVSFAGCKFFNSDGTALNPVNNPVFHNPTPGSMGITLDGSCTVDSSLNGQFSMLMDNPGPQDEILDGFSTTSTSNLGLAGNPLFPTPGSSGLSYPGGYYGTVLCNAVAVRGSVMNKITGNVSIVSPNTETAILTSTLGVGLWRVSATAAILITGGVPGNYESCDLYISSGAASGTAVFSMAVNPGSAAPPGPYTSGVSAISSGASAIQNATNPVLNLSITGEISVTTPGTIVLCAFSTVAATVMHLSPTHNLGGCTNIIYTPVGN